LIGITREAKRGAKGKKKVEEAEGAKIMHIADLFFDNKAIQKAEVAVGNDQHCGLHDSIHNPEGKKNALRRFYSFFNFEF
jgi:hypothetical protein